jgi:predicted RNA binding protein YcfA (HicA-like mRNA interferase family)
VKFREVENLIKQDGWYYTYTTGSHYYYKHPNKPGKVSIPFHGKEIKNKTLNSILKQAGLK